MAKMSLLDIVQEILKDMTSDNVNSISDTYEAEQVANIVKRTYINMHAERVWPHTGKLVKLEASTDGSRPTHMRMAEDVTEILWVKYDTRKPGKPPQYTYIEYKRPDEFLDYVFARDANASNVETVIDFHGTPLFIKNDQAPTCFTTFDDEWLVFDSYDKTVDSTLQSSKTQVFAYTGPEWEMRDDYVPKMPAKVFPYFVNEAKSACFLKVKEVFSQKDEQAATRQRSWLSREKRRVDPGTKYPDYGRKGPRRERGGYRNNHFTG